MKKVQPELFVRGNHQLARYEPGSAATGRRLTEFEVHAAYDSKVFAEIDEHLSAVLLRRRDAIEHALRTQRTRLGVTRRQLATAADVDLEIIEDAETDADKCGLRVLEHLAFVLGLDPAQLSVHETAGADPELGVRLRVLKQRATTRLGRVRLAPRTVLRFSEAASIILTQNRLQDWLQKPAEASGFETSPDYSYPTWRAGYDLAGKARDLLGIGPGDPIKSMRELVENRLGIPIIQLEMSQAIAGATISSHGRRGIVLNVKGSNSNVWIRRTTLAHELAHILFDPEENLESIRVDSYDELERNTHDKHHSQDNEERRANAFAVEFLAPREAVKDLVPTAAMITAEAIADVMSKFGIGPSAARFHVGNTWYQRPEDLPPQTSIRGAPTDEQQAAENFTQDFFPIPATPAQRRGRFALLTAEAVNAGLITADTAAQYLACTENEFSNSLDDLLDLAGSGDQIGTGARENYRLAADGTRLASASSQERKDTRTPRKGKGAGKRYRSAITGRYVKKSTAKRDPRTTVSESAKPKKRK